MALGSIHAAGARTCLFTPLCGDRTLFIHLWTGGSSPPFNHCESCSCERGCPNIQVPAFVWFGQMPWSGIAAHTLAVCSSFWGCPPPLPTLFSRRPWTIFLCFFIWQKNTVDRSTWFCPSIHPLMGIWVVPDFLLWWTMLPGTHGPVSVGTWFSFLWVLSRSGCIPTIRLLCFIFMRKCQAVVHRLHILHFHKQRSGSPITLHPWQHVYFSSPDYSHSHVCAGNSVWHLSMCLLNFCMSWSLSSI